MTIYEIRDYIDELKKFYRWLPAGYPCSSSDIAHKLLKVRAMLHQLEQEQKDQLDKRPRAKWEETNWHNEIWGTEKRCSNCGFETLVDGKYCTNCGAEMNKPLPHVNIPLD